MFYSVNVLYKSARSDSLPSLWEEKLFLISAIDEDEAKEKAEKIAKSYEAEFRTMKKEHVTWRFYKIERVYAIDGSLQDGSELFSRFLRSSEVESILTPFDN